MRTWCAVFFSFSQRRKTSRSEGTYPNVHKCFDPDVKTIQWCKKVLMTQNILTFGVVTAPDLYMKRSQGVVITQPTTLISLISNFLHSCDCMVGQKLPLLYSTIKSQAAILMLSFHGNAIYNQVDKVMSDFTGTKIWKCCQLSSLTILQSLVRFVYFHIHCASLWKKNSF